MAGAIIIGFSVAMLMTMIIWLLDKMFSPTDAFTKACYIAGYLFLSVISVGFGFGFYWKVLESRGEASRSAESAITQVQTALFAASTRLEQLQSTLDQLTTVSSEKAVVERDSGKSCPNSGPGDGPRRKMREEDAGRFKFASDFVKGRIGTVKSDMAALDGDLQKIVKDDRSVIDARTGNRNEFLRGVGRKLDLTDARLTARVGIGLVPSGGFGLVAVLDLHAPRLSQAAALDLMSRAHEACPYSRATRGNIEVTLSVGGAALEQQAA
jgi:uncharacterized membrane protein